MNKLYPIKFIAEPRERVWGGKYLIKKLKKEFPEEDINGTDVNWNEKNIGESWEIWSLFGQGSQIANGFLAENTIDEVIETYLGDFMGDSVYKYYRGIFPVLIKILDVEDKLSIQVHPDDKTAEEMEDSFGKAEFWYIMDAKPDAKIYMGFNRDITPQELYDRIKNSTLEEVLNVITPQKGDCFYIEPGCVHSASGGVVIAEIQESSDVTYRIYDWGRENNPATARKMHIQEAIGIIDYKQYNKDKYFFKHIVDNKFLVNSSHFIIKAMKLSNEKRIYPSLVSSFIIYMCVDGKAEVVTNDHKTYDINKGETILIPAGMEDFMLKPKTDDALLLEVYMPQISEEPDSYIEDKK